MTFDPVVVRAAGLLLPVLLLWGLWAWRRPDARLRAAATLAFAWHVPALLLVHELAARAGWWSFAVDPVHEGTYRALPVDLWIGWCTLWGALPVLGLTRVPIVAVLGLALVVDLVLMPLCAPVVRLGPSWLAGEAVALGVALLPAQLLARWTVEDRRLVARATLQAIGFGGLTLVAALLAIELAGGSARLARVAALPPSWLAVAAQLVALPLGLGVSAAQEFARRGGGTPLPLDPPRRLVTSGPYAYVANPMQLAVGLTFVVAAAALREPTIAAAGLVVVAFGAGLAGWSEDRDLAARFGPPWRAYRASVRRWWPRWRPFHPSAAGIPALAAARPATLYVAEGCEPCRGLRAFLEARRPIGLTLAAAEDHPARDLERLTYDPGDGTREEDGTRALGRALEHLHLGWALLGFALRLPVLGTIAQVVADLSGAGPQRIPRRAPSPTPTPSPSPTPTSSPTPSPTPTSTTPPRAPPAGP